MRSTYIYEHQSTSQNAITKKEHEKEDSSQLPRLLKYRIISPPKPPIPPRLPLPILLIIQLLLHPILMSPRIQINLEQCLKFAVLEDTPSDVKDEKEG